MAFWEVVILCRRYEGGLSVEYHLERPQENEGARRMEIWEEKEEARRQPEGQSPEFLCGVCWAFVRLARRPVWLEGG